MKNLFLFSAEGGESKFLWNEIALDKNILGGKAEWAKQQLKSETADALGNLLEKDVLTKNEVIQLLDTDEAKKNWNHRKDTPQNPVRYVLALQAGLTILGYVPGKIDALFGGNTKAAVVAFQTAEGLKVDGAPGPETIGKMLEKLRGISIDPVEAEKERLKKEQEKKDADAVEKKRLENEQKKKEEDAEKKRLEDEKKKQEEALKKKENEKKVDPSLVVPPMKPKTQTEIFNENIRKKIEENKNKEEKPIVKEDIEIEIEKEDISGFVERSGLLIAQLPEGHVQEAWNTALGIMQDATQHTQEERNKWYETLANTVIELKSAEQQKVVTVKPEQVAQKNEAYGDFDGNGTPDWLEQKQQKKNEVLKEQEEKAQMQLEKENQKQVLITEFNTVHDAIQTLAEDGSNKQEVSNAVNAAQEVLDRIMVFMEKNTDLKIENLTTTNFELAKTALKELEQREIEAKNKRIVELENAKKNESIKNTENKEMVNKSKESLVDMEDWLLENVKKYEPHKNQDTFNRTFPHRFDDHIYFLKDLPVTPQHFVDIGPGIGDYENQSKQIAVDYPAITSREMAEAFPSMNVVVLDLPKGVNRLKEARKNNKKIGESLVARDNVSILSGNGLESLKDQFKNKTDAFSGEKFPKIKPGETIAIRACNSIDIYTDWNTETMPALVKMSEDFYENSVWLFFADKIVFKEANSTKWKNVGNVSPRGFNHNQQTTKHIGSDVPHYLLSDNLTIESL